VFGNPFWGGEMAGVSLTASLTDEVSITAAWAPPWRDTSGNLKNNDTDMFGLFVDFNYDQFVISPWIAYASAGSQSGFWENGYTTLNGDAFGPGVWFDDKSNVYAGGIALAVTPLDSLEIKFDAMYAKLRNDSDTVFNLGGVGNIDALEGDGWLVALAIDYSLDWGTPGFFAWYASGDDDDD
jgi:hypothetical protein